MDMLKFGNHSHRYPKRGGALGKGTDVRPTLGGRGLAALLLASVTSVILVGTFASASAGWGGGHPGSGDGSPGWGWHGGGGGGGGSPQPPSKQCWRDDWRAQHPWLCDEPTTTTQPHVEVTTTTASTTAPTTAPTTTPTTAPRPKPPASNPPSGGGGGNGGATTGGTNSSGSAGSGASAQALGQPSLALAQPPAAVVRPPQAVPDTPFGWPPLGGGLDDKGMPTGFLIVIGLAGAAAALMIVRGGFGHRPFLSVPDDTHQTLPFE